MTRFLLKQTAEPTSWTGVNHFIIANGIALGAEGAIGFKSSGDRFFIDNVTIKGDYDTNGSFETTLHEEDFSMVSGYAELGPTHDAAGNLTYDGIHAFTYDAWNRLRTVTKAYRAPGSAPGTGDIELAAVVSQSQYDPLGRRTVKAVTYSADLDGTYHYYYGSGGAGGSSGGGHSLVEERDGSDNVLRQNVWGLMYIDELIQTSLNDDPEDLAEQAVESHYFALHNTQFNVMAIVDASGTLVERYEYTPYGQRTVYTSAGSNDPLAMAPTSMSQRVKLPGGGGVAQPYGLNPIGHQGLYHDEETSSGSGTAGGLIYNRARMLHTRMARFMQRDPLGYVDGMSVYGYYAGIGGGGVDPGGTQVQIALGLSWFRVDAVAKSFINGLGNVGTIPNTPGRRLQNYMAVNFLSRVSRLPPNIVRQSVTVHPNCRYKL